MADKRVDAESLVWRYRYAHDTKDAARCQSLRKIWADWQGEDSLHEMAYGEPIDPAAVAERKQMLIGRLRRIESELAWLTTVETV